MYNISKCMCLLSTVNLRVVTLMLWKIYPMMILATNATFQRLPILALVLLLRLKSLSFVRCIEFLVHCYILLVTSIMTSSLLLIPLSFSLVITFPTLHRFLLMLRLLITMFQLTNDFLQCLRLIILNLIRKF